MLIIPPLELKHSLWNLCIFIVNSNNSPLNMDRPLLNLIHVALKLDHAHCKLFKPNWEYFKARGDRSKLKRQLPNFRWRWLNLKQRLHKFKGTYPSIFRCVGCLETRKFGKLRKFAKNRKFQKTGNSSNLCKAGHWGKMDNSRTTLEEVWQARTFGKSGTLEKSVPHS